jgi:RNA polymerase sigma-70 factor (ECF subfamily)
VQDDDNALARAAANGDVGAFTLLVERYERAVRSFASRLWPSAQADDIAQETFIRAWRSARSYAASGTYRAWLFRIAWRVYLTHRARERGSEQLEPEVHGRAYSSDPTVPVDLARAFATLSEKDRAVAILCFGHGCSHSETAIALDLPLGTVKSSAARARRQLIASLEAGRD